MAEPKSSTQPTLLPMPDLCTDRTMIRIMRRLGGHGTRDAQASMLALRHFGQSFRQILVLTRCYVTEIAHASRRNIMIANCCAPKMTRDEALLLETIALSQRLPARTMRNLSELTGGGASQRVTTVARALNNALENQGFHLQG